MHVEINRKCKYKQLINVHIYVYKTSAINESMQSMWLRPKAKVSRACKCIKLTGWKTKRLIYMEIKKTLNS